MEIKKLDHAFSVCKIKEPSQIDVDCEYFFLSKTDEECSLVCPTEKVPASVLQREDHWRAFRIQGILDFSLIGILAHIATLLAENQISIFALSTYNTDYILTKSDQFDKALTVLADAGYTVI